jgi:hypothetical protein
MPASFANLQRLSFLGMRASTPKCDQEHHRGRIGLVHLRALAQAHMGDGANSGTVENSILD